MWHKNTQLCAQCILLEKIKRKRKLLLLLWSYTRCDLFHNRLMNAHNGLIQWQSVSGHFCLERLINNDYDLNWWHYFHFVSYKRTCMKHWNDKFIAIENLNVCMLTFERLVSHDETIYTLIVRKTLKPLAAVLMMTPGICGCQCNSLISCCPWWINNSCGGTSGSVSVVVSLSTAKSHCVNWSSEPEAANTELSVGCHSIDVIGAVWCLKMPTASPFCKNEQALISMKVEATLN